MHGHIDAVSIQGVSFRIRNVEHENETDREIYGIIRNYLLTSKNVFNSLKYYLSDY
jgi:hypothetical protein